MSDAQPNHALASTIAVSVHGPAGVLDLVVPAGATSVDVAREYAAQTDVAGIPLLQTPLGELHVRWTGPAGALPGPAEGDTGWAGEE